LILSGRVRIGILVITLILLSGQLVSPLFNYHHQFEITTQDYTLASELRSLSAGFSNPIIISDPRTMVVISGLTSIQSPVARLLWESEYDNASVSLIESLRQALLAGDSLSLVNTISTLEQRTLTHNELLNGNVPLRSDSHYFFIMNPRTVHWLRYGSAQHFLYYEQYSFSDELRTYQPIEDYYDQRAFLTQVTPSSNVSSVSLWVNNTNSTPQNIQATLADNCTDPTAIFDKSIEVPSNYEGWVQSSIGYVNQSSQTICVRFHIPVGVFTKYDLAPPHNYYELSLGEYKNFKAGPWINFPPRHFWAFLSYGPSGPFVSQVPPSDASNMADFYDSQLRTLAPFSDDGYFHLVYNDSRIGYVYSLSGSIVPLQQVHQTGLVEERPFTANRIEALGDFTIAGYGIITSDLKLKFALDS
jgi:hypothetical protein